MRKKKKTETEATPIPEESNIIELKQEGASEEASEEPAEELAEGKRVKKNRNRQIRRRTFLVLLLCVAVIGGILVYQYNSRYKGYRILNSSETGYENTANYIRFADNLLKYTPDGVSCISSDGDVVWTTGIDMKMPVAVASGDYAAVADLNGTDVCVFDKKGKVSGLTLPYQICDVDVANQGAFAVVLESDKTNYINLYNKRGEIVYEMQTTIDKSGYPLDISISDNGEKLFTSYLNVGGKGMENNLAAYNFGDVGQNSNADRMVGGYRMEDELVSKVQFINNDTVVSFGTKSISVYTMREKPNRRATIQNGGNVRSVFYSEKFFGFVTDLDDTGTQTDVKDEEHTYRVRAYNLKGKKLFDQYLDFEYDNVFASDKEVILTGGSDCVIFRTNGSVKFRGKLDGKIVSMVPNGLREYVVVYDNHTDTIKLTFTENKKVEE